MFQFLRPVLLNLRVNRTINNTLRAKPEAKVRPYAVASRKVSTVPIYHLRKGVLEFEGSGVLLTYKNRHFLGTAAHVVDLEEGHSACIGGSNPPVSLIDRVFQRNDRCGSLADSIDFAITELHKDEAQKLAEIYKFVSLDPTEPYKPRFEYLHYQLTGFLADDNHTSSDGSRITANALSIVAKRDDVRQIRFQSERFSKQQWFVAALYDHRRLIFDKPEFNKPIKDFRGFSGGSFFLEDAFCPGVFKQFAGVILECRQTVRNQKAAFVGVCARAICDMIAHWYY